MCIGGAVAGGKAGSMMLTTDFHLVQKLIMRETRTFPVITQPQEGFRLDIWLVSLSDKSLNRAAAALLPEKCLNGRFYTGDRIAGDLSSSNRQYMEGMRAFTRSTACLPSTELLTSLVARSHGRLLETAEPRSCT
jgi:hypothetical protein